MLELLWAGYDRLTFKPDQPLTREQMISIKIGLDKGGLEDFSKANLPLKTNSPNGLGSGVSAWSDRDQIAPRFVPAFNSQYYRFPSNTDNVSFDNPTQNVERALGTLKTLKPQQSVTRAEAALCISLMTNHESTSDRLKNRTALEALNQSG